MEAKGITKYSTLTLPQLMAASGDDCSAGNGGGDGGSALPIRFVYSLMTLQHNPPELMRRLIGQLCSTLSVGGLGFLHVPYRVPREQRVRGDAPVMQMHGLPQEEVAGLLRAGGCELLATLEGAEYDRCGGGIGNVHYLIRKATKLPAVGADAEEGEEELAARCLAGVAIS